MIPVEQEYTDRESIQPLTVELMQQSLPKSLRTNITEELVDEVNSLANNDIELEAYRDSILTYASVLTEGRFKVKDYISASIYVTHKMMGCNNIQAYAKTFPSRYTKYKATYSDSDFNSVISSYNKSKLVTSIMSKTLVPTYVQYQDLNAEAIMVSADLMRNAKSEMVKQKAARDVFDMTKQPDELKILTPVNTDNSESISDMYKDALSNISGEILGAVKAGADLHTLMNVPLRPKELEDNEQEEVIDVEEK